MKPDSTKVINRVTRDRLKPLGFVRLSDRTWTCDGGWWLLHVHFGPSGSGGTYTELAVQPLVDWHAHVTLGCVEAPRRWLPFTEPASFEAGVHAHLDELLPIALGLITEVTEPAQMLRCSRIQLENAFRRGLLEALAGDFAAARQTLASFQPRPGIEHERVTGRHIEVALGLVENQARLHDFVDLLILRLRLAIGGDIAKQPPITYPWL